MLLLTQFTAQIKCYHKNSGYHLPAPPKNTQNRDLKKEIWTAGYRYTAGNE